MDHTANANQEIDAKPEVIFPWLTEPQKRLKWIEGCSEITPISDGPLDVGARWVEVHDMGGREYEFEFEITDYDPPGRLRCTAHARPKFRSVITYIVESGLSAHSVTIVHKTRFRGWIQRFLGRIMAKGLDHKIQRDLERLKAVIEGA